MGAKMANDITPEQVEAVTDHLSCMAKSILCVRDLREAGVIERKPADYALKFLYQALQKDMEKLTSLLGQAPAQCGITGLR